MTKTPWFSYRQKPRRVGYYECEWWEGPLGEDWPEGLWFNWWDGKQWLSGNKTTKIPPVDDDVIPTRGRQYRMVGWRGIVKMVRDA